MVMKKGIFTELRKGESKENFSIEMLETPPLESFKIELDRALMKCSNNKCKGLITTKSLVGYDFFNGKQSRREKT